MDKYRHNWTKVDTIGQKRTAKSASCKSNVDARTGALILQVRPLAKMQVNNSGDDEPGALSGETQESSDAGASAALTKPEKGKVAASLTAKLRHQRPLLWPHPCDDQTHFRL